MKFSVATGHPKQGYRQFAGNCLYYVRKIYSIGEVEIKKCNYTNEN